MTFGTYVGKSVKRCGWSCLVMYNSNFDFAICLLIFEIVKIILMMTTKQFDFVNKKLKKIVVLAIVIVVPVNRYNQFTNLKSLK